MRRSKVGLADLKRLKKDLQAEREREALAKRVAVLKKPESGHVIHGAALTACKEPAALAVPW